MKAKTLWVFLLATGFLSASCRHHWGRGNRMSVSDGVNRTEVRYEGDIQFNEDETAISRISPGGYLEYWRNDDHLLAGMNDKGVLQMELHENGKPVDPASAEGKELVAKVIKGMIGLGFDIDGRMDRLYRRGGYAALLSAVDSVDGDYIRQRYLERILSSDSLSARTVAAVVLRVRGKLGGDYEKKELLEKVDTQYLKNDSVCADYLEVVKSMGGDYEKSEAIQHLLRGRLKEGGAFDSLLTVIARIGGDYEKSELLTKVAHKDIREGGSWAGLIRTTTTLGGEYERSNVLIEIGQRLPKADSLRTLYMQAAKTVHSDEDYGRVVKAVEM